MTREELTELRMVTDDVIGILQSMDVPRGPVNWADLHCMEAAFVTTDTGDTYSTVTIEEASPDAWDFQKLVADELFKKGHANVRVITEW